MGIAASIIESATPDYAGAGLSVPTLLQGLGLQPAGVAFSMGMDGNVHAFVFPTLFYQGPLLAGLEFVESAPGEFTLVRVLADVSMGSARAWSPINLGDPSQLSFVIVDHGLETSTGYATWPYGHVWLATDTGDGFEYTRLSTIAAFNHSVAVADITGDGLDDIVVSNMGVKPGGVTFDIHAYVQSPSGAFVLDDGIFVEANEFWGVGAVGTADLDGDGSAEVIAGSYLDSGSAFGALRIFSRASGNMETVADIPRTGLHTTMGVTQILPFDYDQDGDLDLLLSLEGRHPGSQATGYTGNGIEIYRNDGDFDFVRVTASLLAQNVWFMSELQYRELAVADFNFDGFPDIVLQGWAGQAWGNQVQQQDVGRFLLQNDQGTGFHSIEGEGDSLLTFADWQDMPYYWRFLDSADGMTRLFGLRVADGAPMVVELLPLGRDAAEQLPVGGRGSTVMGFGGDDTFVVNGLLTQIDGGTGIDVAVFASSAGSYTIDADAARTVQSNLSADDAHALAGVERLHFADGKLALDLDGHAGTVAKLIGAVFGAPVVGNASYVGIGLSLLDAGMQDAALAGLALQVRLGSGASNAEVVELLYSNVMGETPSPDIAAFFESWLDTGQITREGLALLAADTSFNQANIGFVGLADAGLAYA
ncbi:MAG: VCBS repeat-containing protein [Burkholderiales bacterium]|nr:VCBS repeat-containing protein [Burkholderiales bacterium]